MNPAISRADWTGGDLGQSKQDFGERCLLPRPPLRKTQGLIPETRKQNYILLENEPGRAACVTRLAGSKAQNKQDRGGGGKTARYSAKCADSTCPHPTILQTCHRHLVGRESLSSLGFPQRVRKRGKVALGLAGYDRVT